MSGKSSTTYVRTEIKLGISDEQERLAVETAINNNCNLFTHDHWYDSRESEEFNKAKLILTWIDLLNGDDRETYDPSDFGYKKPYLKLTESFLALSGQGSVEFVVTQNYTDGYDTTSIEDFTVTGTKTSDGKCEYKIKEEVSMEVEKVVNSDGEDI